ncbi:hypothetical protein [Alkalicoccobacillus murimartini]|uniref:LysM domain-containing protein n=1 Tax=Alkalicoccobacillus murimartini TaxID=171685 RepID=A0ABT9YET8_9BACI|nr:hypothetical protein [Alkalicoccobacillus murimartini]MDQ0205574.1 hypothetical protein [Alkalicoccobacillus murimartini]
MKRLFICIGLLILVAGIVADLKSGSLPDQSAIKPTQLNQSANQRQPIKEDQMMSTMSSQEVIVEPGHTVLSVVEHLHQGPVTASIQQIIDDFKALNHALEPDAIQIGKTYLFPIYEKE